MSISKQTQSTLRINSKEHAYTKLIGKNTHLLASDDMDAARVALSAFDGDTFFLSKTETSKEVRIVRILEDIPGNLPFVTLRYSYRLLGNTKPIKWFSLLSLTSKGTFESLTKAEKKEGVRSDVVFGLCKFSSIGIGSKLALAIQMASHGGEVEVLDIQIENSDGSTLANLHEMFSEKAQRKTIAEKGAVKPRHGGGSGHHPNDQNPAVKSEYLGGAAHKSPQVDRSVFTQSTSKATAAQSTKRPEFQAIRESLDIPLPKFSEEDMLVTLSASVESKKKRVPKAIQELASLVLVHESARVEWEKQAKTALSEIDLLRNELDEAYVEISRLRGGRS